MFSFAGGRGYGDTVLEPRFQHPSLTAAGLLWLRDGYADTLEAYTYDGSTEGFELSALRGSNVGPRVGNGS